jgi:hypothetical protein
MSSSPSNVALYGHRTQPFLVDTRWGATTGSTPTFISRLQNIEPSFSYRNDPVYELGHVAKVGTTAQPPEFRITMSQNLTNNMVLDWFMSGKNVAPVTQQQYTIANMLDTASYLKAYLLLLNQDGTRFGEQEFTGLSVTEVAYNFTIGGASTLSTTFIGTSGSMRTTGFINTAKTGTWDTTEGSIQGKDAAIYFTSGSSSTTDRIYRVQTFSIRATFPSVYVKEIGKRSIVGTLQDVPDVTMDFEVLAADSQPTGVFFTGTTTYDYINPTAPFSAYVRVFDPALTEYGNVVRFFQLENCVPVSHTGVRSQVRGLSTVRYSLTVSKETTANSGGLIVSNRNAIV